MKLIFFGGSFDPPHKGHYEIIRKCSKQCHRFIIIPTLNSPLKSKTSSITPYHILQMLELLIQNINSTIEIDEYDFSCSGPSHTVYTIRHIQQKYPEASISMIVGADQLMKFQHWKEYNKIINSVHIIGFNRANCDFIPTSGMNITWIKDFNVDISSTEIREKIAKGKHIGNELIPHVQDYNQVNNLYR